MKTQNYQLKHQKKSWCLSVFIVIPQWFSKDISGGHMMILSGNIFSLSQLKGSHWHLIRRNQTNIVLSLLQCTRQSSTANHYPSSSVSSATVVALCSRNIRVSPVHQIPVYCDKISKIINSQEGKVYLSSDIGSFYLWLVGSLFYSLWGGNTSL